MDDRLITLWRNNLTGTQISVRGDFPGMTRNAIIGRIFRLRKKQGADVVIDKQGGRHKNPAPAKRKRKPAYSAKRQRFEPVPPTPETMIAAPADAIGKPLIDLEPRDCRFVITGNDTREHLFCAAYSHHADDLGNNCYCDYHFRLMRAHGH